MTYWCYGFCEVTVSDRLNEVSDNRVTQIRQECAPSDVTEPLGYFVVRPVGNPYLVSRTPSDREILGTNWIRTSKRYEKTYRCRKNMRHTVRAIRPMYELTDFTTLLLARVSTLQLLKTLHNLRVKFSFLSVHMFRKTDFKCSCICYCVNICTVLFFGSHDLLGWEYLSRISWFHRHIVYPNNFLKNTALWYTNNLLI